MTRSLLILSAALLTLSACNKVDETTSSEDTLRGGTWKRSSLKATERGTTVDIYGSLPDCVKDNTLEFAANFKGTEYRNNKCNAGDADNVPFTWQFDNSGKTLRIYNADETFSFANASSSPAIVNVAGSINAEVLLLSDNVISLRYTLYKQNPTAQTVDTATIVDVFRR